MSDMPIEVRDRARGEQYLQSVKDGTALPANSPGGKSSLQSYRRWQESEQAWKQDAAGLAELREQLESLKATLQPLTVNADRKGARAPVENGSTLSLKLLGDLSLVHRLAA
jgi:hypothetical protein